MTRPVIGSIEKIEEVLHTTVVDEVAVCLSTPDPPLSQEITTLCALGAGTCGSHSTRWP